MDIIHRIIKNQIILVVFIFIFGLIFTNTYIFIGLVGGTLLSLAGFYILCIDGKNDLYNKRKGAFIGLRRYIKRFIIYGLFLYLLKKFFDDKMMICGFLGLLTLRLNIISYFIYQKVKKFSCDGEK